MLYGIPSWQWIQILPYTLDTLLTSFLFCLVFYTSTLLTSLSHFLSCLSPSVVKFPFLSPFLRHFVTSNACRNVHNHVTYIKYINRAIMICLCAQRLVNTDHKAHNEIASNSMNFGLKMQYFQNFSGRCPGPRWGAHSAPQTPSWIFHLQTPLNPDPSTLLFLCSSERERSEAVGQFYNLVLGFSFPFAFEYRFQIR